MNRKIIAHLALLFSNLFLAINFSAVKHLTDPKLAMPFGINVIRIGVSVILFWLLFLIRPVNIKIAKEDYFRFFLCALTGIAINQLFFLEGLSLTYVIHASLLMLITPILIVFIAAWLLKERVGIAKLIGLALGIGGASVLILSKGNIGSGNRAVIGDILVIICAISFAFYYTLVKPLMEKYDVVVATRWIFTIGLFMVLPFGWQQFMQIQWQQFDGIDYTCIALIAIGGTFLAYLFNTYGIKKLGSSIAGFYIYTQPIFAVIIATIFSDEKFSGYKIIAAMCIFAGVYLSTHSTKNG